MVGFDGWYGCVCRVIGVKLLILIDDDVDGVIWVFVGVVCIDCGLYFVVD